jgi:hypothetical protein
VFNEIPVRYLSTAGQEASTSTKPRGGTMSTLYCADIVRIIEPTRKNWATERWRQVAGGRAHRPCEPGPPLVLSDVSTLYFETNAVGGFRMPGFSEERRPDPRTTLGLLTDALGISCGRPAVRGQQCLEIAELMSVTSASESAHRLGDVMVAADAGTRSEADQIALRASGRSSMLRTRPDGPLPALPWPSTGAEMSPGVPRRTIYYQYRHRRQPIPGDPRNGLNQDLRRVCSLISAKSSENMSNGVPSGRRPFRDPQDQFSWGDSEY